MAHKTTIDGTAYEIIGGRTLIDDTAYSIASGKTLVDGTVYEVGFDNGMRTVTIICEYDGRNSAEIHFKLDGESVRYLDGGSLYDWRLDYPYLDWTSPITIEVPVGTQFYYSTEYEDSATEVIVNGSVVYSESTDYTRWPEYPTMYTITENTTLAMTTRADWETYYCTVYTLTITET